MPILDVLQQVTFGQRVAEEEGELLATYFVETDQWHRLFSDTADIVYGPKGAGKSALYSLLVARQNDLFDRNVILAPGENPRGATVFQALVTDPPASEREFIFLWKLYLACLIAATLQKYDIKSEDVNELCGCLEKSGLRPKEKNLSTILRSAFDYVKRILRPTAVEGGVQIDPLTGIPIGITGKITFAEPSTEAAQQGITSVDHLLKLGNNAFATAGYGLWILLDRLDVAFSDSPELEQNALRALFHVYLDILSLNNLRLKIFLRTDIWRRITTSGFREASHITRYLTIEWNSASLLNLVIRRAAQNESILSYFDTTKDGILTSTDTQKEFFYRLFPDQVEAGSRKPNTLDWMLGHTCDATKQTAPRELIHLLNAVRDMQVKNLEVGNSEPEGDDFFRGPFSRKRCQMSLVRGSNRPYMRSIHTPRNTSRDCEARKLSIRQTPCRKSGKSQ